MSVIFLNKPKMPEVQNKSVSPGVNKNATSTVSGARNDLRPNVKSIDVALSDLKDAPRKVRTITTKQTAKVQASVKAFGIVAPILIDKNNVIIDGHVLVKVAQQLDLRTVPCVRVEHLSDEDVRTLRIALNRTQETGEWDITNRRLEFLSLVDCEIDLSVTGFDPTEIDMDVQIDGVFSDEADPLDEFVDQPAPDTVAITQVGDMWQLGKHRILCGNARKQEDLDLLVADQTVSMVLTDAPYNVKVNGHIHASNGKFEEFAEASGEMSFAEFTDFLAESLGHSVSRLEPGGLVYSFMDWRHMGEMLGALERIGLNLKNLCIWVKTNGGMGSLYRSRHELVFVAARSGISTRNNVELGKNGRNRTNVWEYAGATGGVKDEEDDFTLHPTVKPIRLVEDAILDVTSIGETVLDPFLGSGTTLLAAERKHRRCLGLEISPAYVDIAIHRWQAMTGLEAVHAKTGETFNNRAALSFEGCDQRTSGDTVTAPDTTPEWENF